MLYAKYGLHKADVLSELTAYSDIQLITTQINVQLTENMSINKN